MTIENSLSGTEPNLLKIVRRRIMRLVFDLQGREFNDHSTWDWHYSLELAKAMARQRQGDELFVVVDDLSSINANFIRGQFAGILPPGNIRRLSVPDPIQRGSPFSCFRQAIDLVRQLYLAGLLPDAICVPHPLDNMYGKEGGETDFHIFDSSAIPIYHVSACNGMGSPDRETATISLRRFGRQEAYPLFGASTGFAFVGAWDCSQLRNSRKEAMVSYPDERSDQLQAIPSDASLYLPPANGLFPGQEEISANREDALKITALRMWCMIRSTSSFGSHWTSESAPSKQVIWADFKTHIRSLKIDDRQLRTISYHIAVNELETSADWAQARSRKIAWVSSWGTRCGIATYSRYLIEQMIADDVVVLAPEARVRASKPDIAHIVCWHQDRQDDLSRLTATIEDIGATDVMIQFNYGFYDFSALSELIRRQADQGRGVFLTLHSTVDPDPAILPVKLSELSEALRICTSVFVHTFADVERLANLGVMKNVVLLPQGVKPRKISNDTLPRTRARVASYGFFLPGKGLSELVRAIGLLADRGNDVELLMVNADYDDPGGVSRNEIASVRQLISDLGLDERITMVTEFLDDDESLSLLASADLIVNPYQKTGESSSGAVRIALASERPVAVTPLPIFSDVASATFPLPGTTPEALADGIEKLLKKLLCPDARKNPEIRERIGAASLWREANNVKFVAEHMLRMMHYYKALTAH